MRNNSWLQNKLYQIWELLFPEVPKLNKVSCVFKGKWKNKFGHIAEKGRNTEIAINSLFRSELVPEYVIDTTIAHELIHYMHGFNSPLPQKFRYPHKNGIVTKELLKRGFGHWERKEKSWLRREWPRVYKEIT